jgi:hypothetical protein
LNVARKPAKRLASRRKRRMMEPYLVDLLGAADFAGGGVGSEAPLAASRDRRVVRGVEAVRSARGVSSYGYRDFGYNMLCLSYFVKFSD